MSLRRLTNVRLPRRPTLLAAALLLAAGCGPTPNDHGQTGPIQLKVAYIGLTCEAPIFVAQEKGFSRTKAWTSSWSRRTGSACNRASAPASFDANHTLLMYLLKSADRDST